MPGEPLSKEIKRRPLQKTSVRDKNDCMLFRIITLFRSLAPSVGRKAIFCAPVKHREETTGARVFWRSLTIRFSPRIRSVISLSLSLVKSRAFLSRRPAGTIPFFVLIIQIQSDPTALNRHRRVCTKRDSNGLQVHV